MTPTEVGAAHTETSTEAHTETHTETSTVASQFAYGNDKALGRGADEAT